ncbi:bifunctional metallophosphatase/5'-nucleotidase [Alkalihalobacterium alkalinitrilicum]|uniref:bifunctional metallophosphatase/5'-nucleotidase n=1 Tax=Alkalihalobacterium alkalinitrilicum TaxID=427920 RepID=UPI00099501AE|nr:bifunctional UDP-sugar hydrolase/5'-nucleotidase [Alkalihalobacterium alkalinitrilicum]
MSNKITISILLTSDIHGNILPINYGNNDKSNVGLAQLSTIIQQQKSSDRNHIVLIDNGDIIQGTPLTYFYARVCNIGINPMISVMNYMGFDAAVLGNHEFNYGQAVLQKSIKDSKFPWLSANILHKETKLPYYGKPYTIKILADNVKVGILGLTTDYIPNWENPNHIKDLSFENVVKAAKKWVPFLRNEEKVDVVIVSYHGGFERDLETGETTEHLTGENQGYQLCQEVEGIDVLLTGHQHRFLTGKVNNVSIIQPGDKGQALGKVQLFLEKQIDKWEIVGKSSELIKVDELTEPDPKVIELTKTFEEKTQAWLDQPIGKIQGDMLINNPLEIRTKDNALIEFINKVQMDIAKVDISNTALFSDQSPGLHSDVTMRDIVSNYIYPNTLKVLKITGKDMKDALERSASYFAPYNGKDIEVNLEFTTPKPQHYNYDMWEGIEYEINISRPFGERIVRLTYKGEPIDFDKEYHVVMNNYRAGGGGDYAMFQNKEVVQDIPLDVSELLANYILERKVIEATVNHNWKVVHD